MDEKIFIFDEFHWLKEDFERNRASVMKKRPVVRCVHGKKIYECTRGCHRTFTETVDAHATELWRREKEKLFIEKAKSVHPSGTYGYSNVHYVYALENVDITCLTCEKDFPQTPSNHLTGKGCRTCGERAQRKTLENFIREATQVHEHKYTYGNFVYTHSHVVSLVTCPEHGDFPQAPNHHLHGTGCPKCGDRAVADKLRKTLDEFVREANEVHENKYTYGNFIYVDNRTDGLITCPKHGDFPQSPSCHLQGNGCPMCKNQTEGLVYAKLKEKLEILGFRVEHMGNRVSEGVGRMDIRITKGCLIIYVEIDGPHHFRDMSHQKSRFRDVQTKDLQKHLKARAKGHRVIRIDQDWIWRAYTKKSKDYAWLARLQGTIQKISNGDDPGIDEMFLSGDREKYLEHPCYQKEAVKEIISTSDITIR